MDNGPPDWDKFTPLERDNAKLSQAWTMIGLLREIRNILTYIGCAVILLVVLYFGKIYGR
ncbi:MAG: hypothetical protein JWP25_3621 [Bradyrhizobium sp.]|nr:hypothetical protein [Bradyrhizobium sp.]